MQNWIKCSERMPELNRMVLFMPVFDEPTKGFWDGTKWRQDCTWCDSRGYINNDVTSRITHWQPLPEPPQE